MPHVLWRDRGGGVSRPHFGRGSRTRQYMDAAPFVKLYDEMPDFTVVPRGGDLRGEGGTPGA